MNRFALVGEDDRVLCVARDLDGFFVQRAAGRRAFWVVGTDWSGEPGPLGNVAVRVLDTAGEPMGSYHVSSASAGERRPGPDGLVDVEVTGLLLAAPHPLAGVIWDRWRTGPLTGRNSWAEYPTTGREAWLEVARLRARRHADASPGQTFELDGSQVTDRPSVYCAIGEAINGPGGYFGANLDGLADCLRGGFGATAPFDLVWRSAAVAQAHVSGLPDVLEVLAESRVAVILR